MVIGKKFFRLPVTCHLIRLSFGLFITTFRVTSKGASGGEFSEFVTDHLVCQVDWDVLSAVVNGDRVAYHLGQDCGSSRPSFNYLFLACGVEFFDLCHQVVCDKWAFF